MESSMCMAESPKRSSASSSSSLHEFEFWKVGRNPSSFLSQPEALTADELFVNGVLLPLHFLSPHQPNIEPERPRLARTEPELLQLEPEPGPDTTSSPALVAAAEQLPSSATVSMTASISCSPTSGSKRWKDIFRIGEKKEPSPSAGEDKEPRKERKSGGGGNAAEQLSIHIWPFSRSRSAGNGSSGGRTRATWNSGRKVSSAPCSRSNSRGESAKPTATAATIGVPTATQASGARRWAASPGRSGGVHVGRASPVWQVPRGAKAGKPASGRRADRKDRVTAGTKTGGGGIGVRVLNLNVNTCIGYRGQVSCRSEDKDGVTGGGRTAGEGNGGLFGLRTLFSKKVY